MAEHEPEPRERAPLGEEIAGVIGCVTILIGFLLFFIKLLEPVLARR